jgi:hypothetical protein
MNWPTHTDYQDAIQNPQICFAEPDLKAGTATCDMLGLPRVMSGNFASVYELSTDAKRWAVRCFVRQVSGQQGRYARLCQHLATIKMPWLVNFDYYLKGILIRGEWYPIVKMDWVEGSPLNTWIDENINNPEKLRALAAQWRLVVNDMRKHALGHGDYQHGNIMVTPADELRLVDYDGMYCPSFGKGRSPELGHANFQHPRRLAEHYDDTLDNFSALVIYTSLLALAEEPALWKEFYTVDNLILTSADYKNPQNSKGFARLQASSNPIVRQLAGLLKDCSMRSVTDVPWFEEAVAAAEAGTLEAEIAAKPEPTAAESWLDDATAYEGTRPSPNLSRPSPGQNVSRPAPAQNLSRPAPAMSQSRPAPAQSQTPARPASRPAPAQSAPNLKMSQPVPGQPAPRPASRPAPAPRQPGAAPMAVPSGSSVMPKSAPAPATQSTLNYQQEPEEKSSPARLFMMIGAVVVIILVIVIFSTKRSAPNLAEPPTVQTQ